MKYTIFKNNIFSISLLFLLTSNTLNPEIESTKNIITSNISTKLLNIYKEDNDHRQLENEIYFFLRNNDSNLQKSLLDENESCINSDFFKIMLLGFLGTIIYGIAQDQITARLCIEYFNSEAAAHHKNLLDNFKANEYVKKIFPNGIDTNSPSIVALIWGIAATWWVGLPFGIATSIVGRCGSTLPKLKTNELIQPAMLAFLATAIAAIIAGITGYSEYKLNDNFIEPRGTGLIPQDKRAFFVANSYAHGAAYVVGGISSVLLVLWTFGKRISKLKNSYKELKNRLKTATLLIKNQKLLNNQMNSFFNYLKQNVELEKQN